MAEQYLQKCMCCGRLTDHVYSYERPKKQPYHDEWCVDHLTLCLSCRSDWDRQLPPDFALMSEDESRSILSNANKWLFEKVAKQLEKSHKKFKIKGLFYHTEVQSHCCCTGEYEAADLREALIKFFDRYPTADEILDAKEVKEEKNGDV